MLLATSSNATLVSWRKMASYDVAGNICQAIGGGLAVRNLSGNPIGAEGGMALAEMLRVNKTLLDLRTTTRPNSTDEKPKDSGRGHVAACSYDGL